MKSPIFTSGAYKTIEEKVLRLLNKQADFLSADTAESTRAAGDAIQSIIEDNFERILGEHGGEYSASFARRAMADLAFKDKTNNYYVEAYTISVQHGRISENPKVYSRSQTVCAK